MELSLQTLWVTLVLHRLKGLAYDVTIVVVED
jgi:hypothetical protein